MKKIIMYDTSIATLNMGDEIINYSIKLNFPEIYDDNYVISMPTHTPNYHVFQNFLYKNKSLSVYKKIDFGILCGTNLLYTNMLRPKPGWNIFLHNTKLIHNCICLGVGIGKNSNKVNWYTKRLYKKVLSKDYIHSVRDIAAKHFLDKLGYKSVVTGCPTLWGLNPEFCASIPTNKTDSVIFTLTGYMKDYKNDQIMIDILNKYYKNIYFWPQCLNDLDYFNEFNNISNIQVVNPNLKSYDDILRTNIDYVGNRLHGGIFALQHKVRTIIIGIDYRVEEMSKNFSIPSIKRENISQQLEKMINSEWETKITGLDFEKIDEWKNQFKG